MSTPIAPTTDPGAGNPPTPVDPNNPPASAADPAAPGEPSGDVPLGPAGEKALAEWKARAKTAEKERNEHAARLREFEDRDKTEAERQADALKAAESRAEQATRLAVSASVQALAAGRFQDPQDAVDTLAGGTYLTEDGAVDGEAIKAALDGLLERKPHWAATAPGPRVPAPDPSQGARPGGTPTIGAQIAEATKAGNTKLALALKTQQLREISKTSK
ncbi:hypothetical protein ACFWNG_03865 [Streptomyces sp. NPDC058391]|uniref:hypothetical protein n=1 Tax=Streptomyces sp. NPDC058391 TaxID=3346476 RepID=UPI0036516E64